MTSTDVFVGIHRVLLADNAVACCCACRYVYSLEYGRTVNTSLAHDDAISQLSMCENLLVSSSWDSTVKVQFHVTVIHCFNSWHLADRSFLVLMLFTSTRFLGN